MELSLTLKAQDTTSPSVPIPLPVVERSPVKPATTLYNAGFDVIITNNRNIIYGLVKEVDDIFIKYQRTDIPDGLIYTIRRSEVYAISYRNQVKEFMHPSATLSTFINGPLPVINDTMISNTGIKLFTEPMLELDLAFCGHLPK